MARNVQKLHMFHNEYICSGFISLKVLNIIKENTMIKKMKKAWIKVLTKALEMFEWFEPQHEISNNVVCATSKGSDQPAHMGSLIRAFASRLNILRTLGY